MGSIYINNYMLVSIQLTCIEMWSKNFAISSCVIEARISFSNHNDNAEILASKSSFLLTKLLALKHQHAGKGAHC